MEFLVNMFYTTPIWVYMIAVSLWVILLAVVRIMAIYEVNKEIDESNNCKIKIKITY